MDLCFCSIASAPEATAALLPGVCKPACTHTHTPLKWFPFLWFSLKQFCPMDSSQRKCFNGRRNCGGTLWSPTVGPGFKIYDFHYRLTDKEEEVCLSSFWRVFWSHLRCSRRSLHDDWLWESLLSNWVLMHFLTPSTFPFCHIRCPCWRFLICVIWLFGWIWRGRLEWVPSWGWWQPFPGALKAS